MAEFPLQNIILNIHRAFQCVFYFAVSDFELSLSTQFPLDSTKRRDISSGSDLAVIKHACNRRPPVGHQQFIALVKSKSSNVNRVRRFFGCFPEINPRKVGRVFELYEFIPHFDGKGSPMVNLL
ncbi:hypothetical protein SDC9_77509 [bioreactor metagenome]|uniref:Uncharacterized protein n=1 Tax=bioreactor metagenome TaxID=1076179 RepID=A0A644YR13_9ZZZZ